MEILRAIAAFLARLFAPPSPEAPAHVVARSSRFDECLTHVLRHEGGYADHPADPGGATNRGITIGTLSDWMGSPASKQLVRDLTRDTAAAIYHERYWLPVRGDALGPGLDLAVFDFAVNSGPARAIKALQAAVGAEQDGVMGPATLAAMVGRKRADLIASVCARRLAFLQSLKTWPTFGRGWQRRVSEVQAAALAA